MHVSDYLFARVSKIIYNMVKLKINFFYMSNIVYFMRFLSFQDFGMVYYVHGKVNFVLAQIKYIIFDLVF